MNAACYRQSLALLTDLYQLTMAYGYWKLGVANKEAVFHLTFRSNPFEGGYSVACGLADAADYLANQQFRDDDLAYLATLNGNDGRPLFEPGFFDYLRTQRFACDVDAVPEGTVVFPNEPLLRIKGPILQCQILETPMLNILNFQTLIATKAARICSATRGEPVLEFGLRRAQGVDGALAASRAAYIGGCAATSNVLAGKLFGIPVKGTHAHSWVMSFDDEMEAFDAYASVMPNNCVFLVDTYDTIEGVRKAVEAGKRLRARGHEMVGVRLDSGDLNYLSIEARKILDEGGFQKAAVLATNDLDEHIIASLKEQGAKVCVWGVGTKLVTAYDQPALGGVYKLSAVREAGGAWQYKVKLSEQAIKTSTPGILQVRRYRDAEGYTADMIYNVEDAPDTAPTMIDPFDATRRRTFAAGTPCEELLMPVFRAGKRVAEEVALDQIRQRTQQQLGQFHQGVRRFVHPHKYPVGLEKKLFDLKTRLVLEARRMPEEAAIARAQGPLIRR
jgi:nicotinate phosphoribosyltransferase